MTTRNIVDKKPIRLARGATLRPLEFQFVDAAGTPIDCTGNTVTFNAVLHSAPATKIRDNVPATTIDADTGRYQYKFGSPFPDAGLYRCWLERTVAGETEPLPGNSDYLLVEIYDVQEAAV